MKFIILLIISFNFLQTQTWYNHPELNWKTFETEHFTFYYHDGAEKTISEAALS